MAYLALLGLAALDAAGYSVIAPVIPEIGERTGAGPAVAGALVAAFALGQLAGFPVAGRLVAPRGAVAVLAGSLVLVAIGDLGFVLAERLEVFFPARVLQGIGAGGLWLGVVFGVLERFPGQEYRRLTGVLAAYSVGGIAGPGIAAVGGIAAPFAIHLALVGAAAAVVTALGSPAERPAFASDRAALRTPAFRLSAAGVLLVAIGLGALDGPLPLHFATELTQAEIAALYVGGSVVLGLAAAAAGSFRPLPLLAAGAVATTAGVALAGGTGMVALWLVAMAVAAVGLGLGEAGALGVLLEEIGVERIVLALVIWSQVWAVGYLVGPSAAGVVADELGFAAVGLVPAAGLLLVVAAMPRRRSARALRPRATRG